ncbi:unnamed protein product [Rhodiola kirilowii]
MCGGLIDCAAIEHHLREEKLHGSISGFLDVKQVGESTG